MQEKIAKLRKLKLLFVEDEKELLEIICDALKKLEVNFLTASNGMEALKVLEENNDIDIIVSDINMPHLNGLEMAEQLRKEGNNTPIIIMSAHTEEEFINKAKKVGVENYLLKPFDFIKFIDLVVDMDIK